MKKLMIVLLLLVGALGNIHAQKWDKETKKAFKKSDHYSIIVDYTDLKIAGLDSAEFVSYYCEKEKKKPEFLGLTLKRFKDELARAASKVLDKRFRVEDSTADFVFSYKIYDITEKAGFTGEMSIYPRGQQDNAMVYDFQMKDGRWNSFDVLLLENAEKLGKNIFDITYTTTGFYKLRKAKKQ